MNRPAFAMHYPSLASEPLVDVLRLIRTPHVGPITFFQLMKRFGKASDALAALPELSRRGGGKRPLLAAPPQQVAKELQLAEKFGARMVMYGQRDYPVLLHAIEDPPPLITMMGDADVWKQDTVGMVGARNASATGCQFAQRMAKDLGASNIAVVSGLARGIDSFAHKGALETGTVGVIAGGIDNIYPPENEALYMSLRARGAIISEQPFGGLPFAGSFPGRNRIIAGMSLATVVVEASPKSGSLITARMALEYNREVLAVPGSPMDPRARGCNQLLKQGAVLAESATDVLAAIRHLRAPMLQETRSGYDCAPATPEPESEMEKTRMLVEEKLGITPVDIDTLVEQCERPAASIMAVLLEMELAGRIRRSAGSKVAKTESTEEPELLV